MDIIELKNITKIYGERKIFDGYSLSIQKGDFAAIMGPSGCGKTTMLNMIGLLEEFDEGELKINGYTNVKPNSSRANELLRNNIGYLFQNFALVDDESVEYNLSIALRYVRISKKQKRKKIGEILEYVGLGGFEKRSIYELSGGEQQRVAIARIMLKPCNIVLADEPTGCLDVKNRDIVIDFLEDLNKQGKTIIIVTHDKYVAERCRRVIYLNNYS